MGFRVAKYGFGGAESLTPHIGVFRRGLVDRYFSHLLYVPAVLGVLGGVGASLDDGTVFEDGVEDIGEDDDGGCKQHGVGPRLGGETGGDDAATQSEEDDEMAAQGKRMVTQKYVALGLGSPPTGSIATGRHALNITTHAVVGAVEVQSDISGVEEEDA